MPQCVPFSDGLISIKRNLVAV